MVKTASTDLLTTEEAQKVEWGEALEKDYFYVPTIYYGEPTENYEEDWYSLRFNDKEPSESMTAYASKVTAGKTLWQAVREDLRSDFLYPRETSFVIESAIPFDTTNTKDGRTLTRILVWLKLDVKIDIKNIRPAGFSPTWHYEGESLFAPILVSGKPD